MKTHSMFVPTPLSQQLLQALDDYTLASLRCVEFEGAQQEDEVKTDYEGKYRHLEEQVAAIREAFQKDPAKHLVDMATASIATEHQTEALNDEAATCRMMSRTILQAAGIDPDFYSAGQAEGRAEERLAFETCPQLSKWVRRKPH